MEYKQVIAVRGDLKMSPGKMAAQVAHAALSAAEQARRSWREWHSAWMEEGQRKVVVKVSSLEELEGLFERVRRADLPCYLVRDAGFTELPPGTVTALGIGPAPEDVIDVHTGHLKLL